jgi:hypothetical protein
MYLSKLLATYSSGVSLLWYVFPEAATKYEILALSIKEYASSLSPQRRMEVAWHWYDSNGNFKQPTQASDFESCESQPGPTALDVFFKGVRSCGCPDPPPTYFFFFFPEQPPLPFLSPFTQRTLTSFCGFPRRPLDMLLDVHPPVQRASSSRRTAEVCFPVDIFT